MKLLLPSSLLSALLLCTAVAKPIRCASFSDAATQAKERSLPFAVYIHGASWQPVSAHFLKEIWNNSSLDQDIKRDLIFTNIHIEQQLDKEARKQRDARLKGCNLKAVTSYPAIQFYTSSGQLLKTYQGQSMRVLGKQSVLTTHLQSLLDTHERWVEQWNLAKEAQKSANPSLEISALSNILALPINRDNKALDALRKIDPKDTSGWIARSDFKHWNFIRHVSGLIKEEKIDEAHTLVDTHLENPHFTPVQQAIIYGAKGRIHTAEGNLEAAYSAFQKAYALDQYGPDGKSLMSYGNRVAGQPLRLVLPPQSTLAMDTIGENISRNYATATASSGPQENIGKLFIGSTGKAGHAFHTEKEKNPSLIIDLHAQCLVSALYIENRRKFEKRSQQLTLWASANASDWTQVWQAEKSSNFWDISLTGIERPRVKARYLKLSLERAEPEFFHLNRVDIFGVRP